LEKVDDALRKLEGSKQRILGQIKGTATKVGRLDNDEIEVLADEINIEDREGVKGASDHRPEDIKKIRALQGEKNDQHALHDKAGTEEEEEKEITGKIEKEEELIAREEEDETQLEKAEKKGDQVAAEQITDEIKKDDSNVKKLEVVQGSEIKKVDSEIKKAA